MRRRMVLRNDTRVDTMCWDTRTRRGWLLSRAVDGGGWGTGDVVRDGRDEAPQEERTVDALASGADEGRGQATKRLGELRASADPRISEWGNPTGVIPGDPALNT